MGKSSQIRQHIVSFRVTDLEAGRLDVVAQKHGRTRNDVCRAICLHYAKSKVPEPVKPKRIRPRRQPSFDVQELAKLSGELGKIGSNLNQMARVANASGHMPEKAVLGMMFEQVKTMNTQVQKVLNGDVS